MVILSLVGTQLREGRDGSGKGAGDCGSRNGLERDQPHHDAVHTRIRQSALAKGGRRLKSNFDVAFDLLTICQIMFLRKPHGGLDLLTEARLEEQFPILRQNLPRTLRRLLRRGIARGRHAGLRPAPAAVRCGRGNAPGAQYGRRVWFCRLRSRRLSLYGSANSVIARASMPVQRVVRNRFRLVGSVLYSLAGGRRCARNVGQQCRIAEVYAHAALGCLRAFTEGAATPVTVAAQGSKCGNCWGNGQLRTGRRS